MGEQARDLLVIGKPEGISDMFSAARNGGDPDFRTLTEPVVVLSDRTAIRSASGMLHVVESVEAMLVAIGLTRAKIVVIDSIPLVNSEALLRLESLATRNQLLVYLVIRGSAHELPKGADVIVEDSALGAALLLGNKAARIHDRPVIVERLLGVSLLAGSLNEALESTADHLAAGFGVDRCLISVRQGSVGSAATGTRTWSSLSWNRTADRCRAAASSAATMIAPAVDAEHALEESYLGVKLETSLGSGFLGLVVSRPRIFNREIRDALQTVALRLAAELGWRALHNRATDDLDRLMNSPGLDPLLGIWNQSAVKQLTAMQVAGARRAGVPLVVVVLDVVDLQGINARHGLAVGDRLLRRIADAVRAMLREEDIVGRWSGDQFAVILTGIGAEGGQRVADRLLTSLAARPLELPSGDRVSIIASMGVAVLLAEEDAAGILARAADASMKAQAEGVPFHRATTLSNAPRLSQPLDDAIEDISPTIGGAYRLLHEISRGGMGVVYRAEDRALERPVAIKILRPDLSQDSDLVERFRTEAAMLAHLQHPNLVQIYSFGVTGGDSYFVMELVEGESLEQAYTRYRIEHSSMSLPELVVVIEQIASALDALHDRGIVHRDVKPANVIRDPFRGRSVLVDVGIARRYGQSATSSGTPGFIAPEVLAELPATARSDVYGLAATAYVMLTLTRPWGEGDVLTIIARQCSEQPRPPSASRPELAPVDEILLAALSNNPADRPDSAGAFARDFAAALATITHPTDAHPHAETRHLSREQAPDPSTARTRGVVFRSVTRALGIRETERLRDTIGGEHPDISLALHDTAPLSWLPTELFLRLLQIAPEHVGRDSVTLARDVARATVRASFRRFFPASSVTLVPERTLSAIRNVWGRYHSWGTISSMPISSTEVVVRISDTLLDPALCAWTGAMLEQLVVLSGGKRPSVVHDACAVHGGKFCLFHITWEG